MLARNAMLRLTARRRIKRDLRSPDPRLVVEVLLRSVQVPLTVWNENAILSHANDAARRLFGVVATPPATAEYWMRILEPRTLWGAPLPDEDFPVNRALQGESPSTVYMHIGTEDGGLRLEAGAKPILDPRGRTCGAVMWSSADSR